MDKDASSNQELIIEVENVYRDFKQQLARFSKEQINISPVYGCWSAGQVAAHLIKSNGGILTQLLHGAAKPLDRPFNDHTALVMNIFRGEEKMKTAPVLEPGEGPHDPSDLLEAITKQRDQQLETINRKDLNELSTELQFPPTPGGLSRYEWIIFMIEHTRRHLKQIDHIYSEIAVDE